MVFVLLLNMLSIVELNYRWRDGTWTDVDMYCMHVSHCWYCVNWDVQSCGIANDLMKLMLLLANCKNKFVGCLLLLVLLLLLFFLLLVLLFKYWQTLCKFAKRKKVVGLLENKRRIRKREKKKNNSEPPLAFVFNPSTSIFWSAKLLTSFVFFCLFISWFVKTYKPSKYEIIITTIGASPWRIVAFSPNGSNGPTLTLWFFVVCFFSFW